MIVIYLYIIIYSIYINRYLYYTIMTNKTLVERELRLTYLNNKITQKQKELKTKYLDINNLIENARIDENKQQIIPLSF